MTDKKKQGLNLDSVQKIVYIVGAVVVLLSGFFATYTNSLLAPIKHKQIYYENKLSDVSKKLDKIDDAVHTNKHDIAIINSKVQRLK